MEATPYQKQTPFQIAKKLEAYILGRLSQSEIDELWITFLQQPIRFEYLETEVQLRTIAKKSVNNSLKN